MKGQDKAEVSAVGSQRGKGSNFTKVGIYKDLEGFSNLLDKGLHADGRRCRVRATVQATVGGFP